MAPSSRAKRAKQTRLTFTPLPSSSPASKKMEKDHGARSYAAVGIKGGRKRKRGRIDEVEEGAEATLPTPERSSHPRPLNLLQSPSKPETTLESSSSASETDIPPSTKRRRVARQKTLDFANHVGSKVTTSDEEEASEDMARSGPSDRLRAGLFGTQHQRESAGSPEASVDEVPRKRRVTRKQAQSSPLKNIKGAREETMSRSSPYTRTTRSKRQTYVELSSDGVDSSDGETPIVVSVGKKLSSSPLGLEIGEPETSGDDVPVLRSSPAKKKARASQKPEVYLALSTSEEDVPASTRKKRKIQSSGRNKRAVTESEAEDEEESDAGSPAPARRRLKKRPRELDEQEQEDLNEDLDFLRSSPPAITPSARVKKPDPRREALEALKRQRAGQNGVPSSSAAPLRRDIESIAISDDEEEDESEDDVTEQEETVPFLGARGVFREDDEDRDFIAEEDPDAPLGAPDIEMPLWASNYSRMKGKELFKYAVEWMVQKKLNPAFKSDDEVYDLAFKKLDDEVRGLAGSKFKSSVWQRDFMVSLEGRPEVILTENEGLMSEMLEEKCQACNRSGHPATFNIQFTGRPYHMSTLEPVEEDDSEDEEEEEDVETLGQYDSKGRELPPASRIYHVGRFCKDNAITAHALEHWRFHLFEWVVVELEKGKHLRPSKIVERFEWSDKKKTQYANKVLDAMVENGQVKKLYRDFRLEIDMAREKKSGWRGRGL
ncbi:hypothetical protein FKW77_006646 [Venturia effusa]|uniref:DUF4211 domain-containing protein n=1 Tax=Venturia effusa TaxID=50376 RepID=A0A517LP54_9PEZI|nr:hypothetical protein FKW77_006646 [Venturia effusa]